MHIINNAVRQYTLTPYSFIHMHAATFVQTIINYINFSLLCCIFVLVFLFFLRMYMDSCLQ